MTKITCDCGAEFVVTPAEDKPNFMVSTNDGPRSGYDDGYYNGYDALESDIAGIIGEEADSIERTIQDVVRDVVRQRDLMREALDYDIASKALGEAENG